MHEAEERFAHRLLADKDGDRQTAVPGIHALSAAAHRRSLPVGRRPSPGRPMPAYLEIHEAYDGEWVRLRLTGELDLGSAPVLRHRLARLRAEKRPVRLDLSGLKFMDSSGIHLLVGAFNDARAHGWHFEVDATVSPQVERLLELTNLRLLIRRRGDERTPARQAESVTHDDRL